MNKEQTKSAAEAMLAWAEGRTVEFRQTPSSEWEKLRQDPEWNWRGQPDQYRIKAEDGEWYLVRDKDLFWLCVLFIILGFALGTFLLSCLFP